MRRHAPSRILSLLMLGTSFEAQVNFLGGPGERSRKRLPSAAACGRPSPFASSRSTGEVVRAALALLPEQPAYISLIDVDAQEDSRIREALRPLEAFTLPGKNGVYLNLCGTALRRAVKTGERSTYSFDVHVLAGIVWHEMAHLAGANEADAQAREEQLWQRFMREGRVRGAAAIRQMQLYASRRHDQF